ncbi:hypothetical protein EMGBD2_01200 [Nitrospirota bacterium]|nr:hypothetical protein EMGBD2_01200 [Nitrospirota bacterium]GDX89914.1 hypothetical protein LBMAG45_17700 [Nitrospirota bacterium]
MTPTLVTQMQQNTRPFASWCIVAMALIVALPGCVSPIAINRAIVAYDQSVIQAENELLLINLLRMRDEELPHFTITASIAATFDFRVTGGLIGQALHDNFFNFSLGGEAAENPTTTLIPVQGEEFTRRVLLPLDHARFEFLAHQPYPLAALLRMTVREIALADDGSGHRVLVNAPGYQEDYVEFRRLVLHLAYLYSMHHLHIAPLVFEESYDLPENFSVIGSSLEGILERGGRVSKNRNGPGYVLTRVVFGRTVITNYPLESLSNEERRDWEVKARRLRANEIPIDIKADSPGGDFPIQAIARLRGLYETLRFVAKGLGPEVEYEVDPDPRTGIVVGKFAASEINPSGTFLLESGDQPPTRTLVATQYKGKYYWLPTIDRTPIPSESWNRGVFAMLHTMYQQSVTEGVTKASSPAIAITK